jgi:hypothetical protein
MKNRYNEYAFLRKIHIKLYLLRILLPHLRILNELLKVPGPLYTICILQSVCELRCSFCDTSAKLLRDLFNLLYLIVWNVIKFVLDLFGLDYSLFS